MQEADEYGYPDGISFFLKRDITKLAYDTDQEQRILVLWNAHNAG